MAKIGLTEGFTLIPEGTHVFQITDVKYKEDFGKLEVYMQTQTGSIPWLSMEKSTRRKTPLSPTIRCAPLLPIR